MRTSIATVCLSGGLDDKLAAAAAAGFDGVEIFENDFLAFDGSPRDVLDNILRAEPVPPEQVNRHPINAIPTLRQPPPWPRHRHVHRRRTAAGRLHRGRVHPLAGAQVAGEELDEELADLRRAAVRQVDFRVRRPAPARVWPW